MVVPTGAAWKVGLVVSAAFLLVVFGVALRGGGEREAPVVGRPAPDFALGLFDGGTFRLSEARGAVVVLNFWASWCVPCRREAPILERTWQAFRDRGVIFVGVNVQDNEAAARRFLAEFGKTYPAGPDTTGRIAVDYGVTGIPETYFVDRRGRIAVKWVGPFPSEARLRAILEDLLR